MISGGHKNLRPFHELRSEPAIRSNDTGQRTPYFDRCHLTIIWIFLRTLDSYNPGQKSLGQWSGIRKFLSFLDIVIKWCNLWKITCSSPSSPIISVWHESRYKPGLEVEDAKWLVRDAIAAGIFNAMLSLERKSSNETSSPFPPPYAKLKLAKNYVVCGLGEGVGHVWLWRKPHKCKCDLRLLSMILQCS